MTDEYDLEALEDVTPEVDELDDEDLQDLEEEDSIEFESDMDLEDEEVVFCACGRKAGVNGLCGVCEKANKKKKFYTPQYK